MRLLLLKIWGWVVRLASLSTRVMLCAFFALFLSGSVWGQFTANIDGTVTDPSGAAVPQAKVTLLNTTTNVSAGTTTDSSGVYRFLSLAPGSYKITVEAGGFSKVETNF